MLKIKKLNPGDPIVIHAAFMRVDDDGDIRFYAQSETGGYYESFIHPDNVSFPSDSQSTATAQLLRSRDGSTVNSQSKHDTTRLFKKGDKVRVVEWNGRKVHDPMNGSVWTVNRNERSGGIANESILVSLFYEDDKEAHIIDIPPCYLELITPVEEQEPYTVDECGFAPTLYVRKNGKVYMTIPYKDGLSLFQTREQALAAAEAERDRLNAEHRKDNAK